MDNLYNEAPKGQITRREFLKLGPKKAGQFTAMAMIGPLGQFVDTGPKTPERKDPAENIVQTGLTEMSANGKDYKISVNSKAIIGLIQAMGNLQYGEENTAITLSYLKDHELEIRVYDKLSEPLVGIASLGLQVGTFIPPGDIPYTPRALVAIPTDTLRELFFPQPGSQNKDEEVAFDPIIVLPHELLHFVSFAKSPLEFKIKSYIDRAVRVSEVIISAAVARNKEYKGFKSTLKFIQSMLMFSIINMIILAPVDAHEPFTDTFSDSHLKDVVKNTPQIRSLVLEAINLTPN